MNTSEPASVPVYIFNNAQLSYTLYVNNGAGISVPETNESYRWFPMQPINNGVPVTVKLDLTGSRNPGEFFIGANQLTFVPVGYPEIKDFPLEIPDPAGPVWQAGQLCLYFGAYTKPPNWVFCRNGTIIAGSITSFAPED